MKATYDSTITSTFCECGENHAGMQMIGDKAPPGEGFTLFDLQKACLWCRAHDVEYELWDLKIPDEDLPSHEENIPQAYFLRMKKCAAKILEDFVTPVDEDSLYNELRGLPWDKQILNQYKKVVNRHTHHNLVFADAPFAPQEPDYAVGKGRLINYEDLPLLSKIRDTLEEILGPKAANMIGEGNHYYEPGKTGIAWHGDTERRRVVGLRLGVTMPLWFRWYHRWESVSEIMKFNLEHNDIYVISEWAVGTEWKKSTLYTLRHCAGADRKGKEYV